MTGRGRATRALIFAVVCVALATGAHWFGSGMVPGFTALSAAVGAAAVVGWFATSRRSGAAVAVTTVAVQIGMHAGFAASMARDGMSPMSLILCNGHANSAPLQPHMAFMASGLSGHPNGPGSPGLLDVHGMPMLAGHLVAALFAGLWMHHSERLLTSIGVIIDAVWRAAVRLVRRLLVVSSARSRRQGSAIARRPSRQSLDRALGAVGLRGPPVTQPC